MNVETIKREYRRALGEFETVFIRRRPGTGSAPRFDTPVLARVTGYEPQEVNGQTIQQGDSRIIVMFDDLVARGFPVPVTDNDFAVVKGKQMAIVKADDKTRRVGGVCIAVEIQARG